MRLSNQTIEINTLATEILKAISFLSLSGRKITFYAVTKRINEVRENNDNFLTVSQTTVKKYMESNLKIKEI